jgi:hypothetical protein
MARKNTRRLAALAALSTLASFGCGPFELFVEEGSGVSQTETRDHADFDAITLATVVDAQVSIGEPFEVVLTCDSNLLELIETRVEDSVLIIEHAGDVKLSPNTECSAALTLPAVRAVSNTGVGLVASEDTLVGVETLANTGAGSIDLEGVTSEETLTISNTGVGTVYIGALDVQRCDATNSGVGSIILEGTAEEAQLNNTGVGSIDASGLDADDPVVNNTGLGSVSVR